MTDQLDRLRDAGRLDATSLHFARAMGRLGGESDPEVLLAAALLAQRVAEQHICLDVRRVAREPLELCGTGVTSPDPEEWLAALRESSLVSTGADPAATVTPLVLDDAGRLFLHRYWRHEQSLASFIRGRAAEVDREIDRRLLVDGLARLFGAPPAGERSNEIDWQRMSAVMAVLRRFCVISGGPGTGKTFTVVKILALLVEQAFAADRPAPHMTLVAPTGKAAARLSESIRAERDQIDCHQRVRDAITDHASTIHRALGSIGGSSTRFRRNARSPLVTDLILVDEASMVDLGLMSRLVAAVPDSARLILLGDMDQLASVNPGNVLGDICNTGHACHHSRAFADEVRDFSGEHLPIEAGAPRETGIWDCIARLRKSYRFAENDGIAALARAINDGDSAAALEVLRSDATGRVALVDPGEPGKLSSVLRRAVAARYRPYLTASDPLARLSEFDRFRVLCAHRAGPFGVSALNRQILESLVATGLIARGGEHYAGRPIIVTVNDPDLRLYNGDVGLVLPDPTSGELRFFTRASGNELRSLSPARLPEHQTVFAMTVHKSQGSEAEEVAVVLPNEPSPVLTRELLYTAVTRARSRVVIHGTAEMISHAIARRVSRSSGLRAALWGAG